MFTLVHLVILSENSNFVSSTPSCIEGILDFLVKHAGCMSLDVPPEFRINETSFSWSVDILLYSQTPSILLCPVWRMISCSSTPAWKSQVAAVTLKEWFVMKPCMTASLQIRYIVLDRVLWPTGQYTWKPNIIFWFFERCQIECIWFVQFRTMIDVEFERFQLQSAKMSSPENLSPKAFLPHLNSTT